MAGPHTLTYTYMPCIRVSYGGRWREREEVGRESSLSVFNFSTLFFSYTSCCGHITPIVTCPFSVLPLAIGLLWLIP